MAAPSAGVKLAGVRAMPCVLHTIEASSSLQTIEQRIHEAEDGTFFELVSLAAATVAGRDVNVIAFRPQPAGGRLMLVEIDGADTLTRQELDVCARRERGRRRLVSYGTVWVGGRRANVAAYRG
jgi:hypothetical protein